MLISSDEAVALSFVENGQPVAQRVPGLVVRLLGGVNVEYGGWALPFQYEKLRSLLVMLVVERGRVFQRDWLAAQFWPQVDEERARQNLRRALANIRQLFGEDKNSPHILHTSRNTVSVPKDAPCWVDVSELERAFALWQESRGERSGLPDGIDTVERAVACYSGPFLDGYVLSGCLEFEQWCEEKRVALQRIQARLLDFLVDVHEDEGRYSRALHYAAELVRLDPWDESSVVRIMNLHTQTGNVRAALAAYERCSELLSRELGRVPGPALSNLAGQLRGRNAADASWQGAIPLPLLPSPASERRPVMVMMCHLASRDGSDHVHGKIGACQQEIEQRIREGDAYVISPYPGCVVAYFGFPRLGEGTVRKATDLASRVIREIADACGLVVTVVLHTGWMTAREGELHPDAEGKLTGDVLMLRAFAVPGDVVVSRAANERLAKGLLREVIDVSRPAGQDGELFPLYRLLGRARVSAEFRGTIVFRGREAKLGCLRA